MGICVYMLDGERSYVRSESPALKPRALTRVDGMRAWRGGSHTADSDSIETKIGPYRPNLTLY